MTVQEKIDLRSEIEEAIEAERVDRQGHRDILALINAGVPSTSAIEYLVAIHGESDNYGFPDVVVLTATHLTAVKGGQRVTSWPLNEIDEVRADNGNTVFSLKESDDVRLEAPDYFQRELDRKLRTSVAKAKLAEV